MSVVIEVTPITFEGTGFIEHISRLWICLGLKAYSIHNKRKHECSVLLLEIWRISITGQYRNAFLAFFRHTDSRRNLGAKIRILFELE
jgi:hypothetical protein